MEIKPIKEVDSKKFKKEWDKIAPGIKWNPKFYKFGAFENNEQVGYTIFETNGGVGYLAEIIVEEKYRGKHYGKSLMNHFIEFCKSQNCHKLTLRTSEEHIEAIKFYERLGFKVEAVHPNDRDNLTWYTYSMFLK